MTSVILIHITAPSLVLRNDNIRFCCLLAGRWTAIFCNLSVYFNLPRQDNLLSQNPWHNFTNLYSWYKLHIAAQDRPPASRSLCSTDPSPWVSTGNIEFQPLYPPIMPTELLKCPAHTMCVFMLCILYVRYIFVLIVKLKHQAPIKLLSPAPSPTARET